MASSEIVRIGFAKQPFMQTIGAQLASVGSGKCEIFLPFDAKLTQQHGFFHGGVISTIADNAADRYKNRKKKFIPNPATYLNEERWNDEKDEVEITSHHQISSMVNQQAEVKQLSQDEIRRLANAH